RGASSSLSRICPSVPVPKARDAGTSSTPFHPDNIDLHILPGYNSRMEECPMRVESQTLCTAFRGTQRLAGGDLPQVALQAKAAIDRGEQVLIFDDATSEPIEVDFRGTAEDVRSRLARTGEPDAAPRGPGRPKLGVVAREVTLLPRHWEW